MTSKDDLESKVKKIFESQWTVMEAKAVPTFKDLSPDNEAKKLNATVLYADMADSTDLVKHCLPDFAARIYKAYLRCAVTIIKSEKEVTITAYDGDRVMAVFQGDAQIDAAVRSAMKINYAVHEIINPLLKNQYPKEKYQLKHVIGIDTSKLLVTRIGVRKDSDLVWVGRAANYAAKLCSLSDKYATYITCAVYDAMSDEMKCGRENNPLVWVSRFWKARDNILIYRSKSTWPID